MEDKSTQTPTVSVEPANIMVIEADAEQEASTEEETIQEVVVKKAQPKKKPTSKSQCFQWSKPTERAYWRELY